MTQDVREWRGQPQEVHDGDTVRVVMDTGFDSTHREWLRLRGVKAPELRQYGGPDALDFVESWLAANVDPALRWPLRVHTYRTSGDNDVTTLGRYVADVWTAAGLSLNDAIFALLAQHPDWPGGIGS